jgi:hypothetical protein
MDIGQQRPQLEIFPSSYLLAREHNIPVVTLTLLCTVQRRSVCNALYFDFFGKVTEMLEKAGAILNNEH